MHYGIFRYTFSQLTRLYQPSIMQTQPPRTTPCQVLKPRNTPPLADIVILGLVSYMNLDDMIRLLQTNRGLFWSVLPALEFHWSEETLRYIYKWHASPGRGCAYYHYYNACRGRQLRRWALWRSSATPRPDPPSKRGWYDVCDFRGIWHPAVILECCASYLHVRWCGWSTAFGEYISWEEVAHRFRPLWSHSYTWGGVIRRNTYVIWTPPAIFACDCCCRPIVAIVRAFYRCPGTTLVRVRFEKAMTSDVTSCKAGRGSGWAWQDLQQGTLLPVTDLTALVALQKFMVKEPHYGELD